MLKKIAWNTFKNTGNINTMMELLEVDHITDDLLNNEKRFDNMKENNENYIKEKQSKVNKNNIQM